MKREDSLPYSQESATELYPEPDEVSLKIYLALFLSLGQGIQNISSLEVYWLHHTIMVTWDVTPCSLVDRYQSFALTSFFHPDGKNVGIRSFETWYF